MRGLKGSLMNGYDSCLTSLGQSASDRDLLACVAASFAEVESRNKNYATSVLLVYAAAMVFLMQAGFAMLCAGCVRKKNVQNTLLKNLLDACGASVAFFSVGYAFAFGGTDSTSPEKTFVGHENFFLMGVEDLAFWFFQYAFSATAVTIIAGTLAERCQMAAYLSYSFLLSGWVYPIIVHAIWNHNGFLSASSVDPLWGVGMVDFAGSGVVHLTGGTTAVFATMILGPRRGRFHDEAGRRLDVPNDFPGSSMSLQVRINLLLIGGQPSCIADVFLMTFLFFGYRCWEPLFCGLVGMVLMLARL
jgi:Amt family ammonium transporter